MPQIEEILTHQTDSLTRLATQYKNNDQSVIPGMISAAGSRAQTLENMLWGILTQTGISDVAWDTEAAYQTSTLPYTLPFALGGGSLVTTGSVAQGANLDVVGRILNFPRGGLDDTDFLTALLAWVRVLLSCGTVDDILTIVTLLGVTNPVLNEYFPAAFIVETIGQILTPATITNLGAFIKTAKSGGVQGFAHYSTASTETTFTFGAVAAYGSSSPLGFNNGYFSGLVGG